MTATINCFVIENSVSKHAHLANLIKAHDALNLITEQNNVNNLNAYPIELVFVDIQLCLLNNFKTINSLNYKPLIIFTSDKTEYAIKAFDYGAVDYLKSPIKKERFYEAVKKVIAYQKLKNALLQKGDYIFIKSNLKRHKVYINDIKWIEALGDYAKVVTNKTSLIVLSTMKSFENILQKKRFLRVHKSYIVNLERIDCFSSKTIEIDSHKIPLSRAKKMQLITMLNNTL